MDPTEENPRPNDPDTALYPYLSLYLVLLAFFIALTSASTMVQERAAGAMQSLSHTFSSSDPVLAPLEDLRSRLGGVVVRQQFLDSIAKALGDSPFGAKAKVRQSSDLVEVRLSTAPLFRDGGLGLTPTGQAMLGRLALALTHPPAGLDYRADVILSAPGTLPVKPGLVTDRAGELVRNLVALGVAPQRLAAGLERGPVAGLRLIFRVRDETPRVPDGGASPGGPRDDER